MPTVRIALIQQPARADAQENLRLGLENARRAAEDGARLICFAELAFTLFHPQRPAPADPRPLAEPVPGPTTEAFADLARETGATIVLNLFERDEEGTWDTSPVITPDGSLLGRTRMTHITDFEGFHEVGYYQPSRETPRVFDTPAGRIGVAICYDRHYPETFRALALRGAEIVLIPQAGVVDEWPPGVFEAEIQAAALQNGLFIGLCNRVGKEDALTFAGESFVCAPDGRVLARAARLKEEILFCDVDLNDIAKSPARQLFLRDRRPELYREWLQLPDDGSDAAESPTASPTADLPNDP